MKKLISLVLTIAVLAVGYVALTSSTLYAEYEIKGSWRDSTGTTGYEFKDDGVCTVTFINVTLPLVGEYDGSIDGVYTISKGEDGNMYVEISYTIPVISYTITNEYMMEVGSSTLTLTDPDSGSSTIYITYEDSSEA